MDDKDFDDLLKNKFESYEHPDVGPSARVNFYDRLASYPSMPWYSKYRTEVFVTTSFMLFTLLNGLLFWYSIDKQKNIAGELGRTKKNEITDSLISVIHQLKASQQPSVFIVDPSSKNSLKNGDNKIVPGYQNIAMHGSNPAWHTGSKFHLGSVSSLPQNIYKRLMQEGVLEAENGEAYLVITDKVKHIRRNKYEFEQRVGLTSMHEHDSLAAKNPKNKMKLPKILITNQLSSRMINEIQDQQYTAGIGINVAPHLDLVNGIFSRGSGGFTPRVGITAEWVTSPHWSIETSLDYMNTKLNVSDDFQSLNLPNLNTELGNLQSAEINTHTLSMPVNLKYRWWLTREHQLVVKAGYTPYFSVRNQYVYTYPYPSRPSNSDLTINTLEQSDQTRFHGGTLTVALGINKLIKKKNFMEVALFYENSLGNVGPEKLGMQLFGIRTAYSFKLK